MATLRDTKHTQARTEADTSGATAFAFLNRRARQIAVGAKYTTIAIFGFEQYVALFAFIKPLAGIGGHGFGFVVTAGRAGNGRFSNHGLSPSV
jgi:hypothetical protein